MDWRKSIEEHPHQETMDEELLSLLPRRAQAPLRVGTAIYGLMQNDIAADEGAVQRCPKCRHRSLRKLRPEEKTSPADSNWRCFECGNDCDEFGNRL